MLPYTDVMNMSGTCYWLQFVHFKGVVRWYCLLGACVIKQANKLGYKFRVHKCKQYWRTIPLMMLISTMASDDGCQPCCKQPLQIIPKLSALVMKTWLPRLGILDYREAQRSL